MGVAQFLIEFLRKMDDSSNIERGVIDYETQIPTMYRYLLNSTSFW